MPTGKIETNEKGWVNGEPPEPDPKDMVTTDDFKKGNELLSNMRRALRNYSETLNVYFSDDQVTEIVRRYFPALVDDPGRFVHGKKVVSWAGEALDMAVVLVQAISTASAGKSLDKGAALNVAMEILPDLRILAALPGFGKFSHHELTPGARLHLAARDEMENSKVEYSRALALAVEKHPDLYQAYKNQKG